MHRTHLLASLLAALLPLAACSDDPPASGTDRYRSEAKTTACVSWCERERAHGCQDASPRLDDCAAYCAGPAGCGDAAPLLGCTDENPTSLMCAGERLGYGPPCVKTADAFFEGARPCEDDTVGVVSKNPR